MSQRIYVGAVVICTPKQITEQKRSGFNCSQCGKNYKQAYEGKFCANCGGGLLQTFKDVKVRSPDAYEATEAVDEKLHSMCEDDSGHDYDILTPNSTKEKRWGILLDGNDSYGLYDLPDASLIVSNFYRDFEKELIILRKMYAAVQVQVKIVVDWG